MRTPFYWKSRGGWYIKTADRRTQLFLSRTEDEAMRLWRTMQDDANTTLPAETEEQSLPHERILAVANVLKDSYIGLSIRELTRRVNQELDTTFSERSIFRDLWLLSRLGKAKQSQTQFGCRWKRR